MPGSKAVGADAGRAVDESRLCKMIALAKEVSERAYCRYSKFRVGAAVLAKSGKVYAGCNVENAAYGSTICAERGAIMQMVAGGDQHIDTLVIYTPTEIASSPCGACRQVINEFGHSARIVSVCDTGDRIDQHLDSLLPGAFGPRNLA